MSEIEPKLLLSLHSFHQSRVLCVACSLNALNTSFYALLDAQAELDKQRPETTFMKFGDNSSALKVFDSSCSSSMHYLLTNMHATTPSEFEAYLAVARSLIEKLSRLLDVLGDETKLNEASQDFDESFNDVTLLFESRSPKATAKTLKSAKWLGRGTNRSNLSKEVYELLYAYLSRVVHVSNMDTLLQPKEDRFLIKAYVLITVALLYHECMTKAQYLTKETREMHEACYDKIQNFWSSKGFTPEVLIYNTTFYSDRHSSLEKQVLGQYATALEQIFKLWKQKDVHILPRYEFIEGSKK